MALVVVELLPQAFRHGHREPGGGRLHRGRRAAWRCSLDARGLGVLLTDEKVTSFLAIFGGIHLDGSISDVLACPSGGL